MLTFKKPVLSEGWMRALLFLVLFTGVYLSATWLYGETSFPKNIHPVYAGAAIFALSAFAMVPVFRIWIDRKPISSIGLSWTMSTTSDINRNNSGNIDLLARNIDKEIDSNMDRQVNDGLLGFLLAIALLGLGSLVLYFNKNVNYAAATASLFDLFSGLLLMSVIALAEEGVFRGYILNNLLDSLNPWLALIVSALLFALLHTGNPEAGIIAVVNVFLAGLLLGLAFVFTRNLWFSIFFHLAWNFLQGPVLGFPVSGLKLPGIFETNIQGNELITGGRFGFEASIIQTVLFIVAIVILYQFFNQRATVALKKNPGARATGI